MIGGNLALGVGLSVGLGMGLGGAAGALLAPLARRLCADGRRRPILPFVVLEAGFGAWAALNFARPDLTLLSVVLSSALLLLAAVDIAVLRLPNVVTLPLIAVGLAASAVEALDLGAHVVGAIVGYGSLFGLSWAFRRLRGRDGMGLGDAKLFAAAGAWLGWRALPLTMVLACLAAFAWLAVRWRLEGRAVLRGPAPFGPSLALAIWLVWIFGASSGVVT